MVIVMMGLSFLLIVGVGLWFLYEQRDKLAGISGNSALAVGRPYGSPASAENIARERYARGEIDQAQYEDIMATLQHN
jgi:uncharacterized membrane protein